MKKDVDYKLDFVLPMGVQGATGAIGPTGPTGPNSIQDLLYVAFENTTVNTQVKIRNYYIFPSNSNVFSVQNGQIFLDKPGYYEYIFSGKLNGITTGSRGPNVTVTLRKPDSSSGFDTISLSTGTEEMAFARTKLINIQSSMEIRFVLSTNGAQNAELEMAKLIIRYLPF